MRFDHVELSRRTYNIDHTGRVLVQVAKLAMKYAVKDQEGHDASADTACYNELPQLLLPSCWSWQQCHATIASAQHTQAQASLTAL